MTIKDAQIRNLRQRLRMALAEAKYQRDRAEQAEYILYFLHQAMPEQVKNSAGLH